MFIITAIGNKFKTSAFLMRDILSYMERNLIVTEDEYGRELKCVCVRCLKAHMAKKFEELKVPEPENKQVMDFFKCPVGHNGYYSDMNLLQPLRN